MDGWGSSVGLSQEYRRGNDRVLMLHEGRWQTLIPHQKPTPYQQKEVGIPEFTFGPEISFAHSLSEAWPNDRIGIMKLAPGGTGIMAFAPKYSKRDADLLKDGAKGPLYQILMEKVAAARKAGPVEFCAFIWYQGSKDMRLMETGERYMENLTNLVSALRRDTGAKNLPFILVSRRWADIPDDISSIEPNGIPLFTPDRPATGLVLKAQWDAQQAIPNTRMVILRDMPHWPTNGHMNTEGQLKTGKIFADAYLEMKP